MNRFKTQGYSMPPDQPQVKPCPDCDGRGWHPSELFMSDAIECERCKGEGVILIDEEE